MTKRWSSTKSGDGKTKRQASKEARHYCKLCGLEDGACICRWLPTTPPAYDDKI